MKSVLVLIIAIFACLPAVQAQSQDGTNGGAPTGPYMPEPANQRFGGYMIIEGDTLPVWYLQDAYVIAKYTSEERARKMARLRRQVYHVYPYAVEAARILNVIDIELKKADRRKDKKQYIKALEAELNNKFKDKLKSLTTTEGVILVKLINRQSGKDVYSIIKELKGGFTARLSQTAFYFYDNNLKTQYDPYNRDRDIEMIVQEIEGKAYYNAEIQNTPVLKMQRK
ncbi:MAG TPA: DUF4294 domain-containing protein [Edaphocola sp.]|nr:DUF4294 domain-containing protein [Edaphocola sp.]